MFFALLISNINNFNYLHFVSFFSSRYTIIVKWNETRRKYWESDGNGCTKSRGGEKVKIDFDVSIEEYFYCKCESG